MMSDDNEALANFYNLARLLMGTTTESAEAREQCQTQPGVKALLKHYDIPYTEPGTLGYIMLHYTEGNNFNTGIDMIIQDEVLTLKDESSYAANVSTAESIPSWQTSALYDLLYRLETDEAVQSAFNQAFPGGGPEAQQAFFAEYMPTNFYGEQDAIQAMFAAPAPYTGLEDSTNKIVNTFYNQYQFWC